MPVLEKNRLDSLQPFGADAVAEFNQRGGLEYLAALKAGKPAEALPVGVLMELLHRAFIRAVVIMFKNMDADHQANGLATTA